MPFLRDPQRGSACVVKFTIDTRNTRRSVVSFFFSFFFYLSLCIEFYSTRGKEIFFQARRGKHDETRALIYRAAAGAKLLSRQHKTIRREK